MKKIMLIFLVFYCAKLHAADLLDNVEIKKILDLKVVNESLNEYYYSFYESKVGLSNKKTKKYFDPAKRYMDLISKKHMDVIKIAKSEYRNVKKGEIGPYKVTFDEALKNLKGNWLSAPTIQLNFIRLFRQIDQAKIVVKKIISEKDKNNSVLIGALARGLVKRPDSFTYKRNFSVYKKISKNIDWVTYEMTNKDGDTLVYGHVLVFGKELRSKIYSLYNYNESIPYGARGVSVEWVGYSIYHPDGSKVLPGAKFSISKGIYFGANESAVTQRLVDKFKINKSSIKLVDKCYKKLDTGILSSFSFVLRSAGNEVFNKVREKYPELLESVGCQKIIEGKGEGVQYSSIFIPGYGLATINIRKTINKMVSNKVFTDVAIKKWGDVYKLREHGNAGGLSDGITLKYNGLDLTLDRSAREAKSYVDYILSYDNYFSDLYYNVDSGDMYNREGKKKQSVVFRYTDLPFKTAESAKNLEKAIVEVYKAKKSQAATELEL